MQTESIESIGAAVSTKVAYTGGGLAVSSWFLSNQFFGLAGLVIGVLGLLTNWYFRSKQDQREQREYETRMRAMGQEP